MSKRSPTIKDVARHAGVGAGTVSRVLNGSGYVGRVTREKVEQAVRELEFRPSFIASGMRSNRLRSIGVIVSDITNPMFAGIVQQAQQLLLRNNYQLFLGVTNNDPVLEEELFRTHARHGVSGIMATLNDDTCQSTAELINSMDIPVVLLNRQLMHGRTSVVANNQAPGCQAAIDHLIDHGHRRIAVMTTSETTLPGRERVRLLMQALEGHGVTLPPDYICTIRHDTAAGFEAMASLLTLKDKPTAVVVASNKALIGALEYLEQHDIAYPNEISLIGFDDTDVTRLLRPAITVVNRDFPALTNEAIDILLARIAGNSFEPETRLLPTWLEKRGSVGPPKDISGDPDSDRY